MTEKNRKGISPEEASYLQWRDELRADPEYQAIYEEEAVRSDLWLQLVAARQAAGLTQQQAAKRLGISQAEVAGIEQSDYDAYSLDTLRRFLKALGERIPLTAAPGSDPNPPKDREP